MPPKQTRQQQSYNRINNLSPNDRNALFNAVRWGDVNSVNVILNGKFTKISAVEAQIRQYLSEQTKLTGIAHAPAPKAPIIQPPTQPPTQPPIQPPSIFPLNFRKNFIGMSPSGRVQQNSVYATLDATKFHGMKKLSINIVFNKDESDKAKMKQIIAESIRALQSGVTNKTVTGHYQINVGTGGPPNGYNSGNMIKTVYQLLSEALTKAHYLIDNYGNIVGSTDIDIYYY